MRTVITLNKNRQDAASEANEKDNPSPRSAGQARQNKSDKQPQRYSEQERDTVAFTSWSTSSHAVQPAEEDMYDPDLAVDFAGTRGYMLQPG